MSAFIDGVSKLWLLEKDHSLKLHGAANHQEMIEHLVRCEMVRDDSPENRQRVIALVAHATQHMDDVDDEGDDDNEPDEGGDSGGDK